MKKLIIGINSSKESADALRLGRALAAAQETELHVAAVIPPYSWPGEGDETSEISLAFDNFFEGADGALDEYVPHRLADRSPAAALGDLAEEIRADAIVVGSHHGGPVSRVLLGNVGEALTHGAPCTVFVAPAGFADVEPISFKQIGVGYDGTPESDVALAAATAMAEEMDASLRLIGVVLHTDSTIRLATHEGGYYRYLRELMTNRLEAAAIAVSHVRVDKTLTEGEPSEELVREATGMDLLVLGSRGYGQLRSTILGGVSRKVMRSASCPVAIVPRGNDKTREKGDSEPVAVGAPG